MILFNNIFLPDPYPLVNTGSICYFNSLLQALGTCTSIHSITFKDLSELEINMKIYMDMISNNNVDNIISSKILSSLHNIKPNFGNGQESASEAFILLIDAINNDQLTSLFLNRFRCFTKCNSCNNISDEKKDHSIIINLFHIDNLTPENILKYTNDIPDYKCERCKNVGAIRYYRLTMLSEIIVVCFNVYFTKKKYNFPDILTFPGKEKNLNYKLISQIEHIGSLNGGHYWSRVLRKNNKCYICNDHSISESVLTPTNNTYIVMYHII